MYYTYRDSGTYTLLEAIRLGVISLHSNRAFAFARNSDFMRVAAFCPSRSRSIWSAIAAALLLPLQAMLLELQTRYIHAQTSRVLLAISANDADDRRRRLP